MWKRSSNTKNDKTLIFLGCISLVILVVFLLIKNNLPDGRDVENEIAVQYMEEMIDAISVYCQENGISPDPVNDPLLSGLIGEEWTEITTTIGHLDAKQTTLNPDFASLMVDLLKEAGVESGDPIALGCSGSFPGLLLASLAGAKALDLECRSIVSLVASSYGANRMAFSILDIYQVLFRAGLLDAGPIAVSLGGEGDRALEWESFIREEMIKKVETSGLPFIREGNLERSVEERMKLYGFQTESAPVIFVNAGGATANIGTSQSVLRMKPGVIRSASIPDVDQQGVIHKALLNDIPVIHLLFIKGLVLEYGLPWDPVQALDAE